MKNIIIILSLFLTIISCKPDSNNKDVNTEKALNNIADNIILKNYAEATENALALKESIITLKATVNEANLIIVKEKFLTAYDSYQKIIPFDFGPAVDNGISTLNIFPTDNSKVDANILNGTTDVASAANISATGFPAMDYLLFNDNNTNTLVKLADVNYINYLEAVANFTHSTISTVNNTWINSYKATFVSATKIDAGGSINVLANSFIHSFERDGREGKIGIPAGVRTLNQAVPTKCEAYYSGKSIQLAKTHIATLKSIFEGAGGESYKSILIELEDKELADKISKQFTTIETSLNTLTDPFSDMLTADNQAAISTYGEYQKLLPLLKVDMTAKIGILITYQDSDGD